MNTPATRSSRLSKVLLAFAISGGLIAAVLSQLDLGEMAARVAAADPGWLGLAACAYLGMAAVRGLRFWALVPSAGLGAVTASIGVQTFVNKFTPFRLGELALPYLLSRHGGQSAAHVLLLLFQVRLLDLWVLSGAAMVAMQALFPGGQAGRLLVLAVGLSAISVAMLAFRPWMRMNLTMGRGLARLFGLQRFAAVEKALGKLEDAIEAGGQLERRQLAVLGASTLVIHMLTFSLFVCIIGAFGVETDFIKVVLGSSIAQVGAVLPVTTVGSIGTMESAWIAGFMMVGMRFSDAALTGLASQIITIVFASVLVVPSHLYLNRRSTAGSGQVVSFR